MFKENVIPEYEVCSLMWSTRILYLDFGKNIFGVRNVSFQDNPTGMNIFQPTLVRIGI